MKPLHLIALSITLLSISSATATEALQFFETKIRPLLASECYECHGADKQKGGLRLDHIEHIKNGGDSGPAIVAGQPTESLLVESIHHLDPDFAMPPKKKLSDTQIAHLENWIQLGAPWPESSSGREVASKDERGFTEADYQWWAVQPVRDVTPPESTLAHPIDSFISERLSADGLAPAPPADRYELVRRAYYDLHGLPPTPKQIDRYVNDDSADAWPRLLDELLASPRYGERWGQHWLDVVRYSESDGYRADDYRPNTWPYRDYVIAAFNDDKPYNEFIREQLAADEFAPDDPDRLIGTAFLRLGIYEWNQRNARMQWDLIMTEMTNATAEVFLGIGIGCAQCHDHKFDPILQKDHYALRAFLGNTWWPEKHPIATSTEKNTYQEKQQAWQAAANETIAKLDELKEPTIQGKIKWVVKQFPDDIQALYRKPKTERDAYEEQLAQLVQRQVDREVRKIKWEKTFAKQAEKLETYQNLTTALKEFDHLKPTALPHGFIATDIDPAAAATYLTKRNDKQIVEPAFLSLLGQPLPNIAPRSATTGRRTALADWIADADNPLSTRVITNRIWQHHFAKGLAPSPNDFGQLGGEPTHPELLDWLTTEFIQGGWSIKKLHRLIMTSATYQQTARREPSEIEKKVDPTNTLLWRYPPHRLSAEQVRDSMLAVSGELDSTLGGAAQSAASKRRSVYTQKRRNRPDPLLAGFDAPAGFASAPDRTSTTTPNQSLMLINGSWPIDRARAMANRLLGGQRTVSESVIQNAYLSTYGRRANTDEVSAAIVFITAMSGLDVTPDSPPDKFPNETGLRDSQQHFRGIDGVGSRALWLQPGSRFEQLDISALSLPSDAFTIEVIGRLEAIYKDASVNTLVSKWNGSTKHSGWALGVTSEKSRYQPRNFIMQLVGKDFQGNQVYQVVPSDLRADLNRQLYLAAVISAKASPDDPTATSVTFYMKDLGDPYAQLMKSVVSHSIVGGLHPAEQVKSFIGGRSGPGHLWDGQVARVRITDGLLEEEQLLIHSPTAEKLIADWDFSQTLDGEQPAAGTSWHRKAPTSGPSPLLSAMTDFCHALINSNEFLYLH